MSSGPRLRFVGDVHGDYRPFLKLCEGADNILQVGDLGFDYKPLKGLDPTRVRAIGGNHEFYGPGLGNWRNCPIFLDDYGIHQIEGVPDIFYVRGAWSIDGQIRQRAGHPASWWPDEELSEEVLQRAELAYDEARPSVMVSHECPFSIVRYVTNPLFCLNFGYPPGSIRTSTSLALQRMWKSHKPDLWVFGHYHKYFDQTLEGTRFVCLNQIGSKPSETYLDYRAD